MHQPSHRNFGFTLFAGVAIAALLAGCQTTQTTEKAPVEERTPSTGATTPGAGTAGTTGSFGDGWRWTLGDFQVQTNIPVDGREWLGVFEPL